MGAEMWMGGMTTESDFLVTRVLAGDEETLRARLAEAVERMGFHVVGEQPLMARRGGRGGARSGCSLDITEYPTELIISFKSLGASATQATFSYTVKNYFYQTKGDLKTLEREADAVAALAVAHNSPGDACASCGTEASDDSRFCRRCGALLAGEAPAELEVLRLTSGARAGYKNIMPGAFTLLVAILLMLPLFWMDTMKAVKILTMFSFITGAMGLFFLFLGAARLGRTLNPKEIERRGAPPASETPRVFRAPARSTAALPPRPAHFSVTESTTELLDESPAQREPLLARRREGDTAA